MLHQIVLVCFSEQKKYDEDQQQGIVEGQDYEAQNAIDQISPAELLQLNVEQVDLTFIGLSIRLKKGHHGKVDEDLQAVVFFVQNEGKGLGFRLDCKGVLLVLVEHFL